MRWVSQSIDPETALCGKMAYLEAAKSSHVVVRFFVSRASRVLFESDLALIKTKSKEKKNTIATGIATGITSIAVREPDLSLIHISEPTRPY